MSRLCKSGAGPVSCPAAGQDCDCPSCIVSLVVNNQLIFFRKYSDPTLRRGEEVPR